VLRRALAILILLGLLASACSSGSDEAADDADDPAPQGPDASILPPADNEPDFSPEEEEAAPQENPDDGRLVVQDAAYQLATMLPDGSEVEPLTDPGTLNSQPSWAPDGSRVAWVAIDEATGQVSVAADRFDRSDYRSIEVEDVPFYLYWDPSASRIAHLSPSTGGIDLGITELLAEDGPTNRRVDRGQPFFMAWGPDGDELLVHASGFRLDRIDLGSATVIVDEFPARFGAATWLPDDSLLYADIEDDEQFLVSTGASGEGRRPLVTYTGALRFSVSNEGNRIVMQAVPADEEDPLVTASTEPVPEDHAADDGMLIAFQPEPTPTPTPEFDDSLDAIDPIETGIPYLMGTFGGEPFPLSENPALAMFPSPDGQTVAWLEAAGGGGAVTLNFDTNGRRIVLPPFIPSAETLTAYFPFFDQYSQSHDFWSPSSNLFVYAGRPAGSDEPDGIWVFDLAAGEQTRIADGVVASFTRTPQAGGARSAL